jgi:uncharacterized metal-binding protein
MPGYKTHDWLTLGSACVLGPVCYWAIHRYEPTVLGYVFTLTPLRTTLLVVGAYLFSGLFLSNDLDTQSRIYKRWGPLRVVWYPYQRLVAHRSMLSHGILIGPLLRVLYLYVMLELVLLVAYRVAMLTGSPLQVVDTGFRLSANLLPYLAGHPQISVPLLVGLILGGLSHSMIDLF